MKRLLTMALALTAAWSATLSAGAETIRLENGDVVTAEVLSKDASSVTIQHPSLGELKIPRSQIKQIYETQDEYDEALAKEAAAKKAADVEAERAADDGLFGTGFLKGWNRRLEAGLSGAEGNSQNFNFRIGFHGDYADAEDRWLYDMVYRRTESGGATTENKFYAALTKDWLLPEEDYFYFANGRYDIDDQQAWDHRLSAFGGVGYQIVKEEDWDVRGRAGIGGNQEIGGAEEGFTLEALLGIEVDHQIADNQSIAFTNTLYPSLEEVGDFRNITTLEYVIAIDRDKGMDLKIGIANEHDSNVAPGTSRNDFTYFATLVWKF